MKYLVNGNVKHNNVNFAKGNIVEMEEIEAKGLVQAGLLTQVFEVEHPETIEEGEAKMIEPKSKRKHK
jgi:hypothetical protein